ncbi:MAG: mandelate racemase/muconate lactonizing enzyme family protein [Burkholderiaceae bacterium]
MKLADLPSPHTSTESLALRLVSLQAFVLRCPSPVPVRTSFGVMHDRPAVFVRAQSSDGAIGWGEIWCNFPACGAEHRANLLTTVLAPLLLQQDFSDPVQAFSEATHKTEILALQCGEAGPIAQVIAGIDLALWDLCARRAGLPLFRLLGGQQPLVAVYASGINPDAALAQVQRKHAEGYRGFKLKIGFEAHHDLANLERLRNWLGAGAKLMADVNQGWQLEQALAMQQPLQRYQLDWLEEPLRCDSPPSDWHQLSAVSELPLAAGENLIGAKRFQQALDSRVFAVLQPDLAKWGGISGAWPVIQKIREQGIRFCPHYLGAGIGLMASAHVLAAAGGDGLLEVDSNDNALRSLLAPPLQQLENGCIRLEEKPGIGITPDLAILERACEKR